jgi:hypothetical protein
MTPERWRVRREGQVRQIAVLYMMGIRPDGYRELLGTWLGAAERAKSWARCSMTSPSAGCTGHASWQTRMSGWCSRRRSTQHSVLDRPYAGRSH